MSELEPQRTAVAEALQRAPIVGVVRTHSTEQAASLAELGIGAGLELIEVTFTVPKATELTRRLLDREPADQEVGNRELSNPGDSLPVRIGMGTVTTTERARQACDAGADFIVSPNVSEEVAEVVKAAGRYLVMGALTPTEIFAAHQLGADIIKVYPLPPVGGPSYLSVVRQPLGDLPMLAAGGFGVDEIPAYQAAGASAFGIGIPLLGADATEITANVQRGLTLATPGRAPRKTVEAGETA